jgi:phosphodiesterase/alkaline phosphatase D-like protein
VNVPSNPPGWSAGKWGEWYPDVFSSDGKLTIEQPKPYWQTGWVKQHDRLLKAMSNMTNRTPLVVSGDLHASALGKITKTGNLDLSANPVIAVLSGSIGTRDTGWPSGKRKILPQPSKHLEMQEIVKPIELHGFTIIDFTSNKMKLQMFTWDKKNQSIEDIDSLQPYKILEI